VHRLGSLISQYNVTSLSAEYLFQSPIRLVSYRFRKGRMAQPIGPRDPKTEVTHAPSDLGRDKTTEESMICNCKEAKIVLTSYNHCYICLRWDDACGLK